MPTYRIVGWQQKYEVNSKGREASSGDKLYKKPLSFYRTVVTGACQDIDYIKLLGIANSRAQEIYGIYHRLVNISSGQERDNRGLINHSINDLALIIGTSEGRVREALKVLCDRDLGWLEKVPEKPGESGKFRESPGKSGALYNETKTKDNETKHIETDKGVYFDFLKAVISPSVRAVGLKWFGVVKPLLKLKNKGDMACLNDIARWLGDQVEAGRYKIRIFDNAWVWVRDVAGCDRPMAALQAVLEKELGYECKSKRAEK